MPWGKMDDKFHRNRKVRELRRLHGRQGREALGCWTFWWSWCLDDPDLSGVVPAYELDKDELESAKLLVSVGLWDSTPDGFRFHDFHEYNPTREQRDAKRAADRERVAAKREASRENVASDIDATGERLAPESSDVASHARVPSQSHTQSASHSRAGARDPGLGLMPDLAPKPSADPNYVGKRDVVAVLATFEEAFGKPLGLRPDPNLTRASELIRDARAKRPEDPLGLIREAAVAACADGGLDAAKAPFAAFCSQPWRAIGATTRPQGGAGTANLDSDVGKAQAARHEAERRLREARLKLDALRGKLGEAEAAEDYRLRQRELGDADDALEAAKRRAA